jgi:UrcA family protein
VQKSEILRSRPLSCFFHRNTRLAKRQEKFMLEAHRHIIAALTLLAAPGFSFAESAPTSVVRFEDLNVNSREGITKLYERIHHAAQQVCRPTEGPQVISRIFWSEWNACMDHAVSEAINSVDNPSLSAYYAAHAKGSTRARPANASASPSFSTRVARAE